jgi:hypothetical protein
MYFPGRVSLFTPQGMHAPFDHRVEAGSAHYTDNGEIDGNKAAGPRAETAPDVIAVNRQLATNCPADVCIPVTASKP